jgi:hypothetical protein
MNATEKVGPVFLQGGINDISMETRGELLDRLIGLERRALLAEVKLEEVEAQYQELIYAVVRKFPNESRHATALRYIQQEENRECAPAKTTAIDQIGKEANE